MAVNEGSKYTNFANVAIGTANGGGLLTVGGLQQNLGKLTSITADTTLVAADSGKTYILDAVGEDIVLPAVTTSGFNVMFICAADVITTNWQIQSAEGDNISGPLVVAGAAVPAAAEDFINIVASAALIGDWVSLYCDGTQWLVRGVGNGAGAITATDPA